MRRAALLMVASILLALGATALLVNSRDMELACQLNLCPETEAAAYARRLLLSGDAGDLSKAARIYRLLVQANPTSPFRWADLGEALEAQNRLDEARDCFERTVQLGPGIPQTVMRAASFWIRRENPHAALPLMARVLALAPEYDPLVFSYYERLGVKLETILLTGFPEGTRARKSFFNYLLHRGADSKTLAAVWGWLRNHDGTDVLLASRYASVLTQRREYDQAFAVWWGEAGQTQDGYPAKNVIYNPGFERDPLPSPFDWRLEPAEGVRVGRDPERPAAGRWCLRVTFPGDRNVSFRGVSQLVVVRPGPARLRAYVRSSELTTDQGVFLRLVDAEAQHRFEARSAMVVGSTEWRLLEMPLHIPSGTRIVRLEIAREPSLKIDSHIKGSFWIDDVSLTTETPAR